MWRVRRDRAMIDDGTLDVMCVVTWKVELSRGRTVMGYSKLSNEWPLYAFET